MSAPSRRLRRLGLPALTLAAACGLAACGSHGTAAGDPTTGGSTSSAAAVGPATSSASPTPTPTPTPSEPGGGGTTLFPGHRVVAYYGTAHNSSLGILGTKSAEGLYPQLLARAKQYARPGTPVIPAYELIADVIQGSPGKDGDYTVQIPDSSIAEYQKVADAHDAMLILDIQPGRSSFLPLAKQLANYLVDPHVALALDPEWRLAPGQVPDQQIGKVQASEVNEVSAWLDALTAAHHLPQKLLLVHQFVIGEIIDKPALAQRAHLAITFNMDGFGGRSDKLSKYKYLASDPRFPLGMKLFFSQDVNILSPAEALGLTPPPSIIDYQ